MVRVVDVERIVCIQAFGGMFCLSGLLGMYGSCATLAGYCMSRYFRVPGINVFKLKVPSLGVLAYIHLIHFTSFHFILDVY